MSCNYCIAIGLILGSAALIGSPALAEPLDKQSCTSLQADRKQLLTRNMQAALDQGPNWVKTHLNEEEIEQVRRFLNIEEQIQFRCRGGGVAKIGPKPEPKTEAKTDGTGIQNPGDVPLPDRKPAPPPSTDAQTKASQALADSDKTAPVKAKATR